MKIAAICINNQGEKIYRNINENIQLDLFNKNDNESFSISEVVGEIFKQQKYDALIFLTSTGIAVRAIAPYIKSKDKDPAVLVIDVLGKYVISLLSGHLGGANDLTMKISKLIKAEPIITTATDNMGLVAPDIIAKNNNLVIDDLKKAKEIAALLVAGKKVVFVDEEKKIPTPKGYIDGDYDKQSLGTKMVESSCYYDNNLNNNKANEKSGVVVVTNKDRHLNEDNILCLIRKNLILGIGCRKDYSVDKMREIVMGKLKEFGFHKSAVKTIATVEIKKDEEAIKKLAECLDANLKIASIKEIEKIQHRYKGSDFVEKTIGVRAVCEPSVELFGGTLITEKLSIDGMTLCIGVEEVEWENYMLLE
ncbi:cobalt-precorrin 5A hydrolase [Clostridium folliculivorans]|uniref:Cobalamin biosynthesis protein CbiG n=1 Tax=Clostridium folliculivorans TaxID=2886038 RepID=A0A9W5Y457_9CLOT|nr:cobalt-precorrin 5A hydrolase [Clostridium folliculivorans]GKU26306.1 cobalamin biosynthesis protein CbiG [Clostridium folliculivorans]GKU31978.1 cobalamin biosynthesis protein CbiG [Clostridium folliculivorans]